jgi:gluconate 2-dehydrogenase gamma chain
MAQATPAADGDTGAIAGFVHFTPFEAGIVAAAAARLIPSDDNGPGAAEARVVFFIDRQLAAEGEGFRGPRYDHGPYLAGTDTQGDQSALDIPYRFRLGIEGIEAYAQQQYQTAFVDLAPDQQDRILSEMEQGIPETFDGAAIQSFPPHSIGSGQEGEIESAGAPGVGAKAFFDLLRQYVVAGFFSDPVHGGNRDMVGWKLIGFPGAQGFVYHDWILRYGETFDGGYKSLADYQQQFSGGS